MLVHHAQELRSSHHRLLRMANLPQLCLSNHSPSQAMAEVTEATKGNFTMKSIESSSFADKHNAHQLFYF